MNKLITYSILYYKQTLELLPGMPETYVRLVLVFLFFALTVLLINLVAITTLKAIDIYTWLMTKINLKSYRLVFKNAPGLNNFFSLIRS